MKKTIKSKELHCELVPKSCWYCNVRSHVRPSQWDKIRRASYKKANYRCEICGDTGKNQGRKHDVECHEIWDYDEDNLIQKLVGLISLCPRCHEVKHYGRATLLGNDRRARLHMKKVNDSWTWDDLKRHISETIERYERHSLLDWSLDLSYLKEHFDIDVIIKREKNIGDTNGE